MDKSSIKIAVVGLGYVGLPLALNLAREFEHVTGFDVNINKVKRLKAGEDPTDEGLEDQLKKTNLKITSQIQDLKNCNFFIVGVPTPIDTDKRPDLTPLLRACEIIGAVLKKNDIVVFESTVYPGVTEDVCGPALAAHSGLKEKVDFKLGYSPERINPGDKEHTLEKIVKVVSAEDEESLEVVSLVYGSIIKAGIYKATSIKTAEAAKVIENTQRDLNIALMNELALIFERMSINTSEVLAAAQTKWNFLKFYPGLVGGHCIGVDPYYLTAKAEQLGYHPQVILAGRRINDDMGRFIAQKTVKLIVNQGIPVKTSKVGILGVTFKENVSDLRNSRVPDIYNELKEFGIDALVHDPLACKDASHEEYGIALSDFEDLKDLDALIFAVSHNFYINQKSNLVKLVKNNGVFIDVKSIVNKNSIGNGIKYWSL